MEDRVCCITGESLEMKRVGKSYYAQGFVLHDDNYVKHEKDMLDLYIKEGYKSLEEAYEDGFYYWTEWEE